MLIAAAIIFAMILYLVDKNHRWRAFWKIMSVILALLALGAGVLLMHKKEHARTRACASRIRLAFPQTYDATTDKELVRRAVSKHPDICSTGAINAAEYEQPVSGKGTKDDPIVIGPDF
jgi:hypothetical protein